MRKNIRARRTIEEMIDHTVSEHADTILIPDGLEAAFVGLDMNSEMPRAVFSRELAIEILMRQGQMSYEDAVEYYEFNVAGAYLGRQTPLWISTKPWITTL